MSAPRGVSVVVDAVTKSFATDGGAVHALTGVSLELEAGQGLAITGPSGCGKSTLLSLIGALEPPTTGSVVVGGVEVSGLDEAGRAALRRRDIGFVFRLTTCSPS